jgi:hypothetical protein
MNKKIKKITLSELKDEKFLLNFNKNKFIASPIFKNNDINYNREVSHYFFYKLAISLYPKYEPLFSKYYDFNEYFISSFVNYKDENNFVFKALSSNKLYNDTSINHYIMTNGYYENIYKIENVQKKFTTYFDLHHNIDNIQYNHDGSIVEIIEYRSYNITEIYEMFTVPKIFYVLPIIPTQNPTCIISDNEQNAIDYFIDISEYSGELTTFYVFTVFLDKNNPSYKNTRILTSDEMKEMNIVLDDEYNLWHNNIKLVNRKPTYE